MSDDPKRCFYKGKIDLSDPEAVQEAIRDLDPEEARAILQASSSVLVGTANLRILTDITELATGDTDPATGEVLTETATALKTGIIYQWETAELAWAEPGTDNRKELAAMMPVFQTILGVRLLQAGLEGLATRGAGDEEMARGIDSSAKLATLFEGMMKPVFDMAMLWFADRSGARAEAKARLLGVN